MYDFLTQSVKLWSAVQAIYKAVRYMRGEQMVGGTRGTLGSLSRDQAELSADTAWINTWSSNGQSLLFPVKGGADITGKHPVIHFSSKEKIWFKSKYSMEQHRLDKKWNARRKWKRQLFWSNSFYNVKIIMFHFNYYLSVLFFNMNLYTVYIFYRLCILLCLTLL